MTSHHSRHYEGHAITRIGWLRAAVLGANDGILSTASLIVGVASAAADARQVLVAGVAGLVAGSLSMAAGEYVSVSSQADLEKADLHRERGELRDDPDGELTELTAIYVRRGLDPALAGKACLGGGGRVRAWAATSPRRAPRQPRVAVMAETNSACRTRTGRDRLRPPWPRPPPSQPEQLCRWWSRL